MNRLALCLALAVLSVVSAVVISCDIGGGGGGTSARWFDGNDDGIYDPYQSYHLWNNMIDATTAQAAVGLHQVSLARSSQRVPWRDSDRNGTCDWVEDPAKWDQVCSAPWIDDNGDGTCDNYYNRPGGDWKYTGEGNGSWGTAAFTMADLVGTTWAWVATDFKGTMKIIADGCAGINVTSDVWLDSCYGGPKMQGGIQFTVTRDGTFHGKGESRCLIINNYAWISWEFTLKLFPDGTSMGGKVDITRFDGFPYKGRPDGQQMVIFKKQ